MAGFGMLLSCCGILAFFSNSEVHAAFIEGLFACESWLAVHMITDIFGLSDRFNVPGAIGDQNWTTRIEGAIKEWDQLYKNQVLLSVEALQKTGRVPAA